MLEGLFALFLGQMLGGGILTVLLKIALTEIPPLPLSALRFLIAGGSIFLLFRMRNKLSFRDRDLQKLLRISLLFAANIGFFAIGLQYTTAIMSQVLYLTVPLLVAILAHFFLNERITKEKVFGFFIVIAGLAFLLYQSIASSQHLTFGTPFGNILILCGCLSWSLYVIFSRKIAQKYSTIKITFSNFLFTALILLLITPINLFVQPFIPKDITMLGIVSVLGLGFGTVVQYLGMQYGIKKTNATTTAFFQYLSPFFAALFAVPILHEKPTANLVAGGLLILAGVFYATAFTHIKKKFFPVLQ